MSMDILGDDVWEYNAPQYVDFAAGEDDPNADAWFDRQNEVGNTIPLINDETCASTPEARRLTRSMCATPKNDKNLPEATEKKSTPAQPKKINKPAGSMSSNAGGDGSKVPDTNSKKFAVPMKAIHPKTKSESTPETRGGQGH